jgi:hypothetical protein
MADAVKRTVSSMHIQWPMPYDTWLYSCYSVQLVIYRFKSQMDVTRWHVDVVSCKVFVALLSIDQFLMQFG